MNKDCKIIRLSTVDSTNTYLKELMKSNVGDAVVIADSQSGGRGRLGRSFSSESGGLYFSFTADFTENTLITAKAAVAVCRALKKMCGLDCRIKWVNDIITDSRKICGILCECMTVCTVSRAIVGIGVNLTNKIPDELKDIAVSVAETDAPVPDKTDLASCIISEFEKDFDVAAEYRGLQWVCGKHITVHKPDRVYEAVAVDTDDKCGLIIKTDDGNSETLRFGEISVKIQ